MENKEIKENKYGIEYSRRLLFAEFSISTRRKSNIKQVW